MAIALIVPFFVLGSCGMGDPGQTAYTRSGCPRCHGSDLGGTRLGPPLAGIDGNWDAPGLRAFLTHPDSLRFRSRRLSLMADQYPAPMPTFEMSDSLRANLVAYLLSTGK